MARIAFLIPNLAGGGAERVALTLVRAFVDRGHGVDLLIMERRGELLDQVPAGVRLVDLGAPRTRNVVRPLVRYLRKRRPDALQASLWPLTVIAILSARLSKVPVRVVVSDHVTLSRQYDRARDRLFLRLTTRFVYPLADARICVSRGSAVDLSSLSGLPQSRFTIIYNPVPIPEPSAAATDVDRAWGGAKVRLLSVGKLKSQKNHKLLLHAFALLPEELDARLVIVGEGELRPELEQLIGELQLQDRVELAGFAADPSLFYDAADLFVLSSDYEGFALVLVEAMHAGLRIVSTDCPDGPAEVLDAGRYGRLAPVGDAEALANAIVEELASKRDAAVQRARAADFSVERAADAYLSLLLGEGEK